MRFKKAFTLAEMMIVFIIIGIIIALGVTSVRPWEKAYKYAYIRMYHALSLAIYNHMVNSDGEDAFPRTRKEMCQALLEYINTSDNKKATECTDVASDYLSENATNSDFASVAPNIRTSNGLYIWIGGKTSNASGKSVDYLTLAKEFKDSAGKTYATDNVRYFVVYVDLNGERTPNTATWSKDKMADIVAFAVTDKYIVIPLGYPMVDSRYMEANVVYPTIDTDANDEASENYTGDEDVVSEPMTYYEAMVKAYAKKKKILGFTDKTSLSTVQSSLGTVSTYLYDFNKAMFGNGASKRNFSVCKTKSGSTVKDCNGAAAAAAYTAFTAFYDSNPTFDETNCDPCTGADDTGSCNAADYPEPVCSVKIYDYH